MRCGKRFSNNKLELYMNISNAVFKYACKLIFSIFNYFIRFREDVQELGC